MIEVSTSILSVEKGKEAETFFAIEKSKTDYFHIDVMDGEFVKNDTHDIMLEYSEYLDHITKVPKDVHLMVKDVKNFIDSYAIFAPNIITFHYEALARDEEVMKTIEYAKTKCRRVGLAIKPETNVEKIKKFLPYIHVVLVMTVEPGKGGQEIIKDTIEKIKKLDKYRTEEKLDFDIEADGGIKVENSQEIIAAGADILVAGTAILESNDYGKIIKELR